MKRTWSWVLVLGALALLGLAGVQGLAADPAAPAAAPGEPDATDAAAAPGPEGGASSRLVADEAGARRAAGVAGQRGDARAAHVLVRLVETRTRGGPPVPLPHVDLVLRSGGDVATERTDLVGEARFAIAGGHGRTATIACLLGVSEDVVLSATQPRTVVLTLVPKLRVHGRVETAGGEPVPGAALVWLPFAGIGGDAPAPWRVGRSRSDGTFDVGVGADGHLGAVHAALGTSAMFAVQRGTGDANAPVQTMTLVLLGDAAHVDGTVRDHRGQVVPHAEIELRPQGDATGGASLRAAPAHVRTDGAGRWAARGIASGLVELSARARGHGPTVTSRRLAPGNASPWHVVLGPACTLRGVVSGGDGEPLAALVTAGSDGAFAAVRATTSSDGRFVLEDLAPGPVTVTATSVSGEPRSVREQLVLVPGDNAWSPRLGDDAGAALRGTLRDPKGRPLARWLVAVRASGGKAPTAATRADGTFALDVRGAARVDLRAYAPGSAPSGFADAVRRDVDPAAGPLDWTIPPTARGRILARVEGPDQVGLPARVTCWHHERAEHVVATANADGTVLLADVPVGTLDLMFEHARYAVAMCRDVAVDPDTLRDLQTIRLGAGGVLWGEVRGPAGEIPPECELTLFARGQHLPATYGAGTYRFPPAPPGRYQLLVQVPGLAGWSRSVEVVGGAETQQQIVLAAGVPRRLRVELPPGAPGRIVIALMVPGRPGVVAMKAGGVAREPGSTQSVPFVLYMPPGGSYEALAWGVDWEAPRTTVTFTAGDDTEVVLRLQRR